MTRNEGAGATPAPPLPQTRPFRWSCNAPGGNLALSDDGSLYLCGGQYLHKFIDDGSQAVEVHGKWPYGFEDESGGPPEYRTLETRLGGFALAIGGSISIDINEHRTWYDTDEAPPYNFHQEGNSLVRHLAPDATSYWGPGRELDKRLGLRAMALDGSIYSNMNGIRKIALDGQDIGVISAGPSIDSSGPAVGSDLMVVLCCDDGVKKFDLRSSDPNQWVRCWHNVDVIPISDLAFGEADAIFVSDRPGTLHKIDSTGHLRWSHYLNPGNVIVTSPSTGPDGSIYVGVGHSLVAVQDLGDSCQELWRVQLPGKVATAPTVGADGTIYVPTSTYGEATLYPLHPDGTNVGWYILFDHSYDRTTSSPLLKSDGSLYMISGGTLYAIDTESKGLADSPWPRPHANNLRSRQALFDINLSWRRTYDRLFETPSDLPVLRRFRDEVLLPDPRGRFYVENLYRHSLLALGTLNRRPALIDRAREVVRANLGSIAQRLDSGQATLQDPGAVLGFLDDLHAASPPEVAQAVRVVRDDLDQAWARGDRFLGFDLAPNRPPGP